jgi:uncharacterized protein YqeY
VTLKESLHAELREAYKAGDLEAVKRLTLILASLLSNQAGASPVQTSVAIH